MNLVAITLSDVGRAQRIPAIKALRAATGGSLIWAKQTHDAVSAGRPQRVAVEPEQAAHLREGGWCVTTVEDVVDFSARVPAEQVETLAKIVRALGGQVDSA